ncbi:MAG: nitrogenase cofactor biosynthesis protein NifB [Clostridia bacterium]|nr:nitrogenase cofactor biosynthesis protein NifB [Clostridia bacterium]
MKNRNFVNLNINPCKMCMPMGAVSAIKGIGNSMIILHGSQGCSTYIRRHMAGHYNEPIDVASSSLNEEGTVYGGESNLKKALRNVIRLYNPEIIGVATTCLAETIGEDIKRITREYMEEEGLERCFVVPLCTPGYGGTQFEGYFAALTGIVKEFSADDKPNKRINIITPSLNPGDVRNIKAILEAFNIDYVLLPDVSRTLDSPYNKDFKRIPEGGTRLQDIKMMGGAIATIELGLTIPESISPGVFLKENFNVPLFRCPLPIGVRNTDKFINILSKLAGKPVPPSLQEERGRLLDGMIDSHKHNAEGRAVIYGEPELVFAISSMCLENGITPVLISTGSQNKVLKQLVEGIRNNEAPVVIDETDFETIQSYVKELNANILIGNSDGKMITEKEGVPLVRAGFPIHDRVGGQRLAYTGYSGTLRLLDEITNTLLEKKYEKYRSVMFSKYFDGRGYEGMGKEDKTASHPCFSGGACSNARMHIPVAPACNISCNYCNRKFDCVNESRPGVTSEVLSPEAAAAKFVLIREKIDNLRVVGIAGPGDALADFENTRKAVKLIREAEPDITFCLSTNGLMLPFYAEEIIKLGVSHVTITINAIDAEIGAKIYKEVNYMGSKLTGKYAAEVLIANQLAGLKYLSWKGVVCKVNIVMIKGINDDHIGLVVKKAKECGAFMTNIMPLIPAKGSVFENMPMTNNIELNALRKRCEIDLKQMYHCKQCRADAVGTLGQDRSSEFRSSKCGGCSIKVKESKKASYTFAVATKSGVLVDQHFGHAEEFHIYGYIDSAISFIEKRRVIKYCDGGEECDSEETKITSIIKMIEDCNAILVMRIGYGPMKRLEEKNIRVIQVCSPVEDAIRQAITEIVDKEEHMAGVV